nr:MafI family immunity protein [Mucilaginibacter flavidus]
MGLPATDVATAQEYLEYNEYRLCLDHIVTQLHECETPIDNEFYHEVEKVAALMSVHEKEHDYIKDLITM